MSRVYTIFDENGRKFRRQVNRLNNGICFVKRNNNLFVVEEIGERQVIKNSSVTTKLYKIIGEAKLSIS